MTDKFIDEVHSLENFNRAILSSVVLESEKKLVTINLITDKPFTEADKSTIYGIAKKYVPEFFGIKIKVTKLTPDAEMVKDKIYEAITVQFKALSVTLDKSDIKVVKEGDGFSFTIDVMPSLSSDEVCAKVEQYLSQAYCGKFKGKCIYTKKSTDDLEIEAEDENIEYEIPIRYFPITDFAFLEGTEQPTNAVYLSDLNFEGEKIVICGTIEDIRERTYTNSRQQEKVYYSYAINDGTASLRITYFPRVKNIEKIKTLKVGDSIVCTGKAEQFNGFLRYTANTIDYGSVPKGFVPEKRVSKPVPKYYSVVKPQPFADISQTDMFSTVVIPDCLKGKTFVVFDLETTGLNSTASSGNMDAIIEIGAYKLKDGVICESFTTFVNPQKKLSEEIIGLTGITEEMVKDAPTSEQVMPDFFKFCQDSILVGHNAANFDFKFVDYYCARLGYMLERRVIDTIPLAQELLFLSNYKLNTIADHFGIKFNHHRAIDDAYVTAKIFVEMIKLKKSLPKLQ